MLSNVVCCFKNARQRKSMPTGCGRSFPPEETMKGLHVQPCLFATRTNLANADDDKSNAGRIHNKISAFRNSSGNPTSVHSSRRNRLGSPHVCRGVERVLNAFIFRLHQLRRPVGWRPIHRVATVNLLEAQSSAAGAPEVDQFHLRRQTSYLGRKRQIASCDEAKGPLMVDGYKSEQ